MVMFSLLVIVLWIGILALNVTEDRLTMFIFAGGLLVAEGVIRTVPSSCGGKRDYSGID